MTLSSLMDRLANLFTRRTDPEARKEAILKQYSANLELQSTVKVLREQLEYERERTRKAEERADRFEKLYLEAPRKPLVQQDPVHRTQKSVVRMLEQKYQQIAEQKAQQKEKADG